MIRRVVTRDYDRRVTVVDARGRVDVVLLLLLLLLLLFFCSYFCSFCVFCCLCVSVCVVWCIFLIFFPFFGVVDSQIGYGGIIYRQVLLYICVHIYFYPSTRIIIYLHNNIIITLPLSHQVIILYIALTLIDIDRILF